MDNTFSSTILYTEHFENSGIAACDIVCSYCSELQTGYKGCNE
jgi:hypothetical protein